MHLSRRSVLAAGAFAGAIAASRSARAERMRLRITRHRIPWLGPKKLRIVHITDIHMGATTPEKFLRRTVEIAHSLEPDLVALTGDYVNRSVKHADRIRRYVASLPSPVIATLGNHDHWSGAEEVIKALIAGGAQVLSNEAGGIDGIGFTLDVVGIDDGLTKHADVETAFRSIRRPEETVVLNHFPMTADHIARKGGRLILSGHTHGGQIVVPVLTEAVSRLFNGYFHGWYQIDESELYVSAGIGHSLDGLRGGDSATPEVAVYDLDPNAKIRESRSYRGA